MALEKIKKQNFESLKNGAQSDLYDTINKYLPELSKEDKGIVAGMCIEYVLKSGGNPDIFIGEDLIEEENEVFDTDSF